MPSLIFALRNTRPKLLIPALAGFAEKIRNSSKIFAFRINHLRPQFALFCTLEKITLVFANTSEKRVGVRVCVATALALRMVLSFMVHLYVRRSRGFFGGDLVYAKRCPGGRSRHIRVRFKAVVVSANSTATFLNPRIRNRRIPRCSFKIPITGSTTAFRRRYNARPVVAVNLLRMRSSAA